MPQHVVRRRLSRLALLVLASPALVPAMARAQGGPPQHFENLQYFPKDIPRDSLIAHMRGFTRALGVRCTYCHVEDTTAAASGGRERLIFKLDDKPQKRKARFMLRMVDSLNHVVLAALPDRRDPPVTVACVTCHRGSPYPQTLETVLTDAVDRYGADSAVARYRALRQDMVSGRYDFSEGSLAGTAMDIAARGNADAALALLQLDQEYYPASPQLDVLMGDVYLQKGDRDDAIARYRAALVKRPNDPQVKRKLQALGVAAGG